MESEMKRLWSVSLRRVSLATGIVLLSVTSTAFASPFTVSTCATGIGTNASTDESTATSASCQPPVDTSTGPNSFILAETTLANADYGLLGVEARGTASTNQWQFQYFSGPIEDGAATASFSDSFTVSSSSAFTGFLVVSDAVSGVGYTDCTGSCFFEPDNPNYNEAQVTLSGNDATRGADTGELPVSGPSPFLVSLSIPIGATSMQNGTYSDAGTFTETLEAGTYCQMMSLGQCDSFMDFLDTSRVTGISLVDANGNPLDASISWASGTDYNAIPDDTQSPTPEPGSLALLGSGLICLAGLVWRKRQA
jgi:hypothetical protein